MKATRLIPNTLVCLLVAGLLGHAPTCAAEDEQAAHKAAAEEVLKAMHMDTLFESTTERLMTMVDRISDGAARQLANKPEAADFQTRMHTQSRDMIKKEFNWDAVKPEFTKVYEDAFSTEELKELASFYNTPLGQKLVSKQPELSERMGKASQERAQQVLPVIVNMVRTESAKLQGNASPAPGTGPGGFPVPPPPPPGMGKMLPPPPLAPAVSPAASPAPVATPTAKGTPTD